VLRICASRGEREDQVCVWSKAYIQRREFGILGERYRLHCPVGFALLSSESVTRHPRPLSARASLPGLRPEVVLPPELARILLTKPSLTTRIAALHGRSGQMRGDTRNRAESRLADCHVSNFVLNPSSAEKQLPVPAHSV